MPHSSAKLPSLFAPAAIVAAFVAAMSACVLGLLVWKTLDARSAALAQGERDIRNLTHSLAEHASHSIQAADVAMSGMVELLKYRKPLPERFNRFLHDTAEALPQIRVIGVLDTEGAWIYSSVEGTPQHNNSDRSYFIHHRDSTDASVYISEPLQSRLSSRPTIVLSKRINNQDGSFGGVLISAIETDYFDNFYKSFNLGPNSGIILARLDGTALTHWPTGQWVEDLSLFRTRIERASSGYAKIVSPIDGNAKYVGVERASQYPIFVAVALPEEEMLSGWHEDMRNDAIVAVVMMGTVVLLAMLLAKEFGKRAKAATLLHEREAHYRLLADNIADIVIRFDRDGRMLFVSQSVEALLGLKPAELREQISVIMIDIDHFKSFNDRLGHQAGDDCLKRVARVIAEATDNTPALAARYGGEEFAVILPGVDEADALKVAEAIRLTVRSLAIANPATSRGLVSISLGIASRPPDTPDETALLGDADLALYEAKRSGRNCSVLSSTLKAGGHSASRKQYA